MLAESKGGAMATVSDAAVEGLAKKLAAKDGYEWQLEWKMPLPDKLKRIQRPILDDAGRERYLTLARQQLNQERDDA